jgi:hypothetical protein
VCSWQDPGPRISLAPLASSPNREPPGDMEGAVSSTPGLPQVVAKSVSRPSQESLTNKTITEPTLSDTGACPLPGLLDVPRAPTLTFSPLATWTQPLNRRPDSTSSAPEGIPASHLPWSCLLQQPSRQGSGPPSTAASGTDPPSFTSSSSRLPHSLRKTLAPVRLPSPPMTHRLVMPRWTRLWAAARRPALVVKALQRALPMTVPPCREKTSAFKMGWQVAEGPPGATETPSAEKRGGSPGCLWDLCRIPTSPGPSQVQGLRLGKVPQGMEQERHLRRGEYHTHMHTHARAHVPPEPQGNDLGIPLVVPAGIPRAPRWSVSGLHSLRALSHSTQLQRMVP